MTDNLTQEQRFRNMSRIKSKNTIPELKVRSYLFSKGLRYRIHDSTIQGKPDLVFKKYRTLIFVNGCFWHGHDDCRYNTIPKTNTMYWTEKIAKNKKRDKLSYKNLSAKGWKVIVIWECELKGKSYDKYLNKVIFRILNES